MKFDSTDAYFLADKQELWFTLNFMDRGDLASRLTAPTAIFPMPEEEIAFISLQASFQALQYLIFRSLTHSIIYTNGIESTEI